MDHHDCCGGLLAWIKPPTAEWARNLEHAAIMASLAYFAYSLAKLGPGKAWKKIVGALFSGLTVIPGVGNLVDGALEKELAGLEKELHGDGDPDAFRKLPEKGLKVAEVVQKMRE